MKTAQKGGVGLTQPRRSLPALLFCLVALAPRCLGQFETRGTFPLQFYSEPFAVAVGDFNHDGKLDAVLADDYHIPGNVAVLLGNGDGTFQKPTYYLVGEEPLSIAVADFNHDGNLDLAVSGETSPGKGCIFILFGNGDGTFQPAVSLPLSAYSSFVAVADFNGDGIPDLLAADFPYISVLLGNGDGTFQAPINNDSFSPTPPDAVGIGDFNRDGKLDVVVVGSWYTTSSATVLLGNGDGTFQLGASNSIGDSPQSVAVADFRGLGILDLAITSGLAVQVLLGNGDGTFQPPVNYVTPGFTAGVAVGDFNLDGKPDLATTEDGNGLPTSRVGVLLGKGDGTFLPVTSYAAGGSAIGLVVGDVNGDTQPDLVIADPASDGAVVLLNTGVVSFSPTSPLSFNPQFVGTTSTPLTVTLTNTGTAALSISSISTNKPFHLGRTTCGSSVPAGAKCTLSAVFKPTGMGFKTGLLVLNDSASSKPQVIELNGTGTVLTVSPTQLNFGSQKVGTKSAPQNVTVTNTGNSAVRVTGVSISGTDLYDYSETNTCGSQINPGATCTISVTFDPIFKGTRSALAVINGPGGAVWQQVPLTGTGI
jgi:FG-GAP-like repeat/Cep192 domain 4/Abnormal spindle-like microcephaly-assoc'd, ASPM-SPD-2-Hydin